jgi:3-carboxy-cis,cis-muconate cycloisomerase
MARDVSLLMQNDVAEAAEPGGSSSSMPHKRNPAGSATILAAATRMPGLVSSFLAAMPQEHERGLGGWHAEAPLLSAIVQTTGAAVAAAADVSENLTVDRDRMRANIGATNGVVFAERAMVLLAPVLGRDAESRVARGAALVKRSPQSLKYRPRSLPANWPRSIRPRRTWALLNTFAGGFWTDNVTQPCPY